MAPPLLTLQDVHLTFGGTPLLEGAELSIGERERVCLVGRNGSGKSTLLKIAAGLVEQDRGSRFIEPGATVRYLPQEPDFGSAATTRGMLLVEEPTYHLPLPTSEWIERELASRNTAVVLISHDRRFLSNLP